MKYKNSEYLELPHGNTTVWRYMNHEKFEKIINSSEIFFPNANKLSDKYEVTIPSSTIKNKKNFLKKSGLSGRDLDEELMCFQWNNNPMKDLVLINCWSVNQYESYALWKIYLGGKTNGIAIKSTVSRLKKSIINGEDNYPEDFYMGKVKYKKHLKPNELSRFEVISTKKPFYDFEKELRVFIINFPLSEGGNIPPYDIGIGRTVKVDLDELVSEIYISPFADENYKRKVEKLLYKLNQRIIIKESEIQDR